MSGATEPATLGAVPVSPQLQRARALFEGRAWAEAHAALEQVDAQTPLELDDLWQMTTAGLLCGRTAAGLAGFERIYESELERRPAQAARAAFWLGFRLLNAGEVSRGNGWLARAEKALERLGKPCVESGYLELPRVRELFYGGDYAGALAAAERAVEIAERFSDPDLANFALNLQGRSRIRMGDVAAGLRLHDEAMLAATKGELSATMTGLVYCSALDSCHSVYDIERMREWTASLKDWCEAQPQLTPFTGECLVHRAEIMELAGDWPAALEEAQRAVQNMQQAYGARASGTAWYRQGELHRLLGELAAAEDCYREASQAGRDPQPGLALLRLAQGKGEQAAQGLRRALSALTQPLSRVALLSAVIDVALSSGALEEARAAVTELGEVAESFESRMLSASALDARGRVALAGGDPQQALGSLRSAFEIWQELGAPYHAARTRVQLACACQAVEDEDGAMLEIAAARACFERLGAAFDLAQIDALLGRSNQPAHGSGLTARELEVLRLVAAGKTNKLIASQLCLSEKTVDRHVSNILGKLDVPSRAAATAYAYENKLIS